MNLTLTLFDGTRGAFELIPDIGPESGIVAFTARPSRHERALTQEFLAGYGVNSSLSGAGRSEASDWRYLHARAQAYGTQLIVVRHADLLSPQMLEKVATFAADASADLALTCDEAAGDALGVLVTDRGGSCHEEGSWLLDQFSDVEHPVTEAEASFPHELPDADFYMFRSRCRELLSARDFKIVDDLYVSTAGAVAAQPFAASEEAADWIRSQHDAHPSRAQLKTLLRGAQAAMFRAGSLLKCDLETVLATADEGSYRRLNADEIMRLRRYRQTWRSTVLVLRDAGMSVAQMEALTIEADLPDTLSPVARGIVDIHRAFRRLEGAAESDPLLTENPRRFSEAIRQAGVELGLPVPPTIERRDATITTNWRAASGICLVPLTGPIQPEKRAR